MRTPVATAIAAALLSTLLAAGCASAVPGTATAVPPGAGGCVPNTAPAAFSDGRGRFGITPPRGWKADTSGRFGNAASFLDPDVDRARSGPFAANVGVRVAATDSDLATAVAGVRQELATLNEYAATADEALTVGDCLPAHLFGGTFTDVDSGLKLRNLQVLVVHAGTAVVVTGSALQETWTDHESQLDAAVRSLTVPS